MVLLMNSYCPGMRDINVSASTGWCLLCILCSASEDTDSSYLVDPASSHMLVSKIKPCMSKYKQVCTVKLRMAH